MAPEMRPLADRLWRSKIVRFGLVGVANSVVDLAVFTLAIWLGTTALLANLLGWAVAVCCSYVANSRWSFDRDTSVGEARSFLRFVSLGALITLGVSSLTLLALTDLIGVFPAKLIGLVLAAILNFVAARWSIENRVL